MKDRKYFDLTGEVRCWLDPDGSADFSFTPGWTRRDVENIAKDYAQRLRAKADLIERWLFHMRYGACSGVAYPDKEDK